MSMNVRDAVLVAVVLIAVAALVFFNGGIQEEASAARDVDERLVRANTTFGFDLLQRLHAEGEAENTIISPASVSFALSMTYQGASGETKEAMADVLGYGEMDSAELNQASADLLTILSYPGEDVQTTLANALFKREGIEFREEFLDVNREYYGAETRALDFSDPAASGIINDWVKEQTRGKIEDIVDEDIDPDTIMFLINALHFQGDWSVPFDEDMTQEREFHRPDGDSSPVSMMHRQDEMYYLEEDDFQAVRLPYGGEERMSMYVFLPAEDVGLDEFTSALDEQSWSGWMESFSEVEGSLLLPRFTVECEEELEEALTDLGMGIAFDDSRANFENMRPIPPVVYLASVRHKTFVEVDETGTEAAAATSVEVAMESAPVQQFTMEVDRPFLFAIRDDATGTILFLGSVFDPG